MTSQTMILEIMHRALVRINSHKDQNEVRVDWQECSAEQLGLDSLDLAEVLLELEFEIALAVSPEVLMRSPTFADLATELASSEPSK